MNLDPGVKTASGRSEWDALVINLRFSDLSEEGSSLWSNGEGSQEWLCREIWRINGQLCREQAVFRRVKQRVAKLSAKTDWDFLRQSFCPWLLKWSIKGGNRRNNNQGCRETGPPSYPTNWSNAPPDGWHWSLLLWLLREHKHDLAPDAARRREIPMWYFGGTAWYLWLSVTQLKVAGFEVFEQSGEDIWNAMGG